MKINCFAFVWLSFCLAGCWSCATTPVDPFPRVLFEDLSADGSGLEQTTELSLTFYPPLDGLTVDQIEFNPGQTGAQVGSLVWVGDGNYVLTMDQVSSTGMVEVAVSCSGYEITPKKQEVKVFHRKPPVTPPQNDVIEDEIGGSNESN